MFIRGKTTGYYWFGQARASGKNAPSPKANVLKERTSANLTKLYILYINGERLPITESFFHSKWPCEDIILFFIVSVIVPEQNTTMKSYTMVNYIFFKNILLFTRILVWKINKYLVIEVYKQVEIAQFRSQFNYLFTNKVIQVLTTTRSKLTVNKYNDTFSHIKHYEKYFKIFPNIFNDRENCF